MLIKSNDDVVSFSFQPEDAVGLTRFSALSSRVRPALFELIQSASSESKSLSTGLLPSVGPVVARTALEADGGSVFTASQGQQY